MNSISEFDSIVGNIPNESNSLADFDSISNSIPVKKMDYSKALGSNMENFAAGMGKSAIDTARGAKQLLDIPAVWLEKKFPGLSEWVGGPTAQESAAKTQADIEESKRLDEPLTNTKSGLAGEVVGSAASMFLPFGAASKLGLGAKTLANPTTYKTAAIAGGIQGALQPTTEDESKLANVEVGVASGMAGNLGANVLGRVAQPVQQLLSSAHEKSVNVLERAGINLDAAQKTGSSFLNKIRSSFWDNPITAGAQSELANTQKTQYNRAVLKTIGTDADAATPEVMGKSSERINGVFKDILNRNDVILPDQIVSRIADIQKNANLEEKKSISGIADRIMNAVGGNDKIEGQIAYGIKKDLDRMASSQDTTLAFHARQLRSALMDAINGSLSKEDQIAFAQARTQFSNMKNIENAIDKTGSGDISPSRLANTMATKSNRAKSIYGQGDQNLVDLAHAGNMLLPDRNPNSGTVSRLIASTVLPAAVVGGGEGLYSQDPEKALYGAVGGAVLPKAAQTLMNNPKITNYLTRGMTGKLTPIRDFISSPQTNETIGGIVRRLGTGYEEKVRSDNK